MRATKRAPPADRCEGRWIRRRPTLWQSWTKYDRRLLRRVVLGERLREASQLRISALEFGMHYDAKLTCMLQESDRFAMSTGHSQPQVLDATNEEAERLILTEDLV